MPPALTGRGVRIAVVDGTFTSHPDVSTSSGRTTFVVNASDAHPQPVRLEFTPGPEWTTGAAHGTWAAAAAAGNGALCGGAYDGLAPEADLFLVAGWRPGRPNATSHGDRVASLTWVLRHWRTHRIRAVLASTAGPDSELLPWQADAQRRAAEALAADGVLVVAGTGNVVDRTSMVSLAATPSALTVGGVLVPVDGAPDAAPAYHGCRGTTFEGKWVPEVLAPAENLVLPYVRSQDLRDHFFSKVDEGVVPPGYARTEGASFSGPVVLGAAACLWQAHPDWSARQVRAALVETAIHRPQWAPLRAGLIAVAAAAGAAPPAGDWQDDPHGDPPYHRYLAWRREPVDARLRAVAASEAPAALDALLSFLPEEAPGAVAEAACAAAESPLPRLRAAALCVLATRPASLTHQLITRGLDDRDPYVRIASLHALSRRPDLCNADQGSALGAALASALNDPHPDVRHRALRLAQDLKDVRLLRPLVDGLDDDLRRGTATFFARCRALASTAGVEFPQDPPWTIGECHYTERRLGARQRLAATWRDWFNGQRPA